MKVVTAQRDGADQRALLDLADRSRRSWAMRAVVLGGAERRQGWRWSRASPAAPSSAASRPPRSSRGAAEVMGGGGGGRDDVAQAGGRDPERLEEALAAARVAIERALGA